MSLMQEKLQKNCKMFFFLKAQKEAYRAEQDNGSNIQMKHEKFNLKKQDSLINVRFIL